MEDCVPQWPELIVLNVLLYFEQFQSLTVLMIKRKMCGSDRRCFRVGVGWAVCVRMSVRVPACVCVCAYESACVFVCVLYHDCMSAVISHIIY